MNEEALSNLEMLRALTGLKGYLCRELLREALIRGSINVTEATLALGISVNTSRKYLEALRNSGLMKEEEGNGQGTPRIFKPTIEGDN